MKTNEFLITISMLFLSVASPMLAMESKDEGDDNRSVPTRSIHSQLALEKKLNYLR